MKVLILISLLLPTVNCFELTNIVNFVTNYGVKNYEISYNTTSLSYDWEMTSFSKIAAQIITLSRDSLPFDLLKDVVKSMFNPSSDDGEVQVLDTLLKFEAYYLVMATAPLVISLFVFVFGITCFKKMTRKKGKKKNGLDEKDVLTKRNIRRFFSASFVMVCTSFLLIAAIGGFYTSERMDASIELANEIAEDTLENIKHYIQKTASMIDELLGNDYDLAMSSAMALARELPYRMNNSMTLGVNNVVNPYFKNLDKLDGLLVNELLESFHGNCTTVTNLIEVSRIELIALQTEINKLYTDCIIVGTPAYVCNLIDHKNINITNEVYKIPNVDNIHFKMAGLRLLNFSQKINESKNSFDEIGFKIIEKKVEIENSIQNVSEHLGNAKDELKHQLNNITQKVISETIDPILVSVSKIRKNFVIQTIEFVVSITLKTPVFIIFFMFFITIMALAIGQFGINHIHIWKIHDASPPIRMSRLAKDLLLSSLLLFWFTCLFLAILLACFAMLGSNMTLLCKSFNDGTFVNQVIDDPQIWGGYPISKSLHKNSSMEITLSDVLYKCRNMEAIWNVLQFQNFVNSSGITDIRQKTPHIDDVLGREDIISNSRPPNFNNKSLAITLDELDVNLFMTYKYLLFDIEKVSKDLQEYETLHSGSHPGIANDANQVRAILAVFKYNTYSKVNNTIEEMRKEIYNVSESYANIQAVSGECEQQKSTVELFFQSGVSDLLSRTFANEVEIIFNKLIRYGSYLMTELRTKVGECHLIPEIYDTLTSFMCYYITDSLNGMWLSLGIVFFSYITFLPAFVDLIEHYRIGALDFSSDGDENESKSLIKFNIGKSIETSCSPDVQWT